MTPLASFDLLAETASLNSFCRGFRVVADDTTVAHFEQMSSVAGLSSLAMAL